MQGDVTAAELIEHARVALGRGDLPVAERALEAAYSMRPFDALTLRLLALLRRLQRRLDEAETLCRRAIARVPDDAMCRAELGLILATQGRNQEAGASYREALRLNPNEPEFFVRLGLLQQTTGDFKGAETNHRAAIKLEPKLLYARQALAAALIAQDRLDDAETLLRQALADTPEGPRALASLEYDLAQCLIRQGRHEEALAGFDRALARVPDFEGAAKARADTLRALRREA